jgi:hypothetical protein
MKKLAFLAAMSAFALSGTAHAQTVTASNPQSVISALQTGGYKATLSKDSTGDPRIESAASGAKYYINFYGCTKNVDCASLTFYAAWSGTKATVESINQWNQKKRFSRAYIDSEGDPAIEFDINLDKGGESQALFLDTVQIWEEALGGFMKHINN